MVGVVHAVTGRHLLSHLCILPEEHKNVVSGRIRPLQVLKLPLISVSRVVRPYSGLDDVDERKRETMTFGFDGMDVVEPYEVQ